KVDGALSAAQNVANGNYGVTVTSITPGIHAITAYLLDAAGNTSANSPGLSVTVDTTRPTVSSSSFGFDAPQQNLQFVFSEDVHDSLDKEDMLIRQVVSGNFMSTDLMALQYAALINTATVTFPGFDGAVLPDADYKALLFGTAITDLAGNELVNSTTNFFVLSGDANRDRVV